MVRIDALLLIECNDNGKNRNTKYEQLRVRSRSLHQRRQKIGNDRPEEPTFESRTSNSGTLDT